MRRAIRLLALGLGLATVPLIRPALAQAEQQALVDRATLTAQEMLTHGDAAMLADLRSSVSRARAAMVCPRVFRAGFIFGGQGGPCVLLARDGAGSWSSPAFYAMGGGSFGLQAGVQDMQVLMLIMTDKGLRAVMENQFKIGADASVAIATIGGGIQGATTTAAGADIVSYARSRGLFAGVALEGSVLNFNEADNRTYYGRDVTARQVLLDMQAHNPGSDPLRAMLMQGAAPAAAAPAQQQQAYGQAAPAYGRPADQGITRETLR
ncbi:lipid-binding SYLF domain-containing protein [Roseomonas sp. OT10]|uniref:lipid-binding SYLF domain-containing protein n=1 Tax=Roseomonas cutis TaxID=2897332 RepID=UPI001E348FD6|nr:lipid-binding SYLF domain-containing protein [Roseomonas sp. OT10]UFN50211.1 lipid-binding SYLF domain-containing protein [Roseomonas sp. OT10]